MSTSIRAARPAVLTATGGAGHAASRAAGLIPLGVLCLLALLLSMTVGARALHPLEVWNALVLPDPQNTVSQVVWQSRVPRTVLVLLAGAALGVAGALMQAVTRNPLADPGILGVNAGASLAVVLGLAFFGVTEVGQYMWWSFAGALLTSILVFAVGHRGPARSSSVRITLSGVALGAVLSGFSSAVLLTHSQILQQMRGWSAGTTASQSLAATLDIAPYAVVGLVIALLCTRALNVLALGEAQAVALGAHPQRIRVVALIAIALLAGGATAAAGPIGFLGLLAPHLARLLVGPHQTWVMAYSILIAPTVLGFADVIGRVLVPGEMPVGIVTAFIGAPLLIHMVRRTRVSEA
ncbi:iron chelate uptake ABC transporter family permease subunit [Kocuria rhizophila]|uniref:iron chelate uptake ABC transporter family permease subunit n=1 Tax=Kocuria rhizophila TaxID=72000 RepID=UPI001EF43C21|nr:iron chelate uptake ABC transporter family permease subunit [Kocuria rhizophila]MCG7425639.1 iron chelate uptake ABC transporter family permease subunit [Kocuria rhizophila]MCT1456752.1 iron chelate uptake ABC transporter family permease subunit [Kocuria rhizophila]MCT1879921.1 iron chelate uptake ABC transporter family permease subunit [Kocuria rhizophila]MCT2248615.1 iron chelate uptake ABC transporter family permease subunit [Kocuria rhizophila]